MASPRLSFSIMYILLCVATFPSTLIKTIYTIFYLEEEFLHYVLICWNLLKVIL